MGGERGRGAEEAFVGDGHTLGGTVHEIRERFFDKFLEAIGQIGIGGVVLVGARAEVFVCGDDEPECRVRGIELHDLAIEVFAVVGGEEAVGEIGEGAFEDIFCELEATRAEADAAHRDEALGGGPGAVWVAGHDVDSLVAFPGYDVGIGSAFDLAAEHAAPHGFGIAEAFGGGLGFAEGDIVGFEREVWGDDERGARGAEFPGKGSG